VICLTQVSCMRGQRKMKCTILSLCLSHACSVIRAMVVFTYCNISTLGHGLLCRDMDVQGCCRGNQTAISL
jgi:hypothetical protein